MWWESDFGASRNVVLPRFFLAHRLGRPLERSEIAWGCLWVRLGCARGQNKISNSYSQFGLRGRAPRGVTGELSPASVYAKTKSRLIEIHGFLPFSARRCALVPIPIHHPDLSRPLSGPYESPRPMRDVRALGGGNPHGGCRPRVYARCGTRIFLLELFKFVYFKLLFITTSNSE